MKLEAILSSPVAAWMAMERRVNDGSPSGATTTTSPATSASGPTAQFDLPFYGCELTAIGEPLPADEVPPGFPVHPDITDTTEVGIGMGTETEAIIPVIPTASGRTVALAAAPDRIHFKLHYPGILGRFSRRLDRGRAEAAINSSALLTHPRANLGPSAGLLPEPTALISPNGTAAVIRLATPHPPRSNETGIIPLFSLWSADQDRPEDPIILNQLLQATQAQADEVIYCKLLRPIVDTWLNLGLSHGLWCEWNAQNLLITIDEDANIQRVIFRDLQGIHRDPAGRPAWADRLLHQSHRILGDNTQLDRRQRSWLFDFKLAEYVLDPLLAASTLTSDQQERLVLAIRARVDQQISSTPYLFPSGYSTWGQPSGPTQKGRWIVERLSPPRYRTPTLGREP